MSNNVFPLEEVLAPLNELVNLAEDLTQVEYLADQLGSGGVLTFTFSAVMSQIWVHMKTLTDTEEGRYTIGTTVTPNATFGSVLLPDTTYPITANTQTVKVFAPAGSRVSVYGYRR